MNMETGNQTIQLLDAKALGQRLSLSKRQIFRLNSFGKLPPAIRIGGVFRWAESTIAEWLAAGAPDRATFETSKQQRGRNNAIAR